MLPRERAIGELTDPAIRKMINGEEVPVGTEAGLDGELLIVSDAREVTCLAAEGELPFTAPPGWTIFSVDLRSTSGRCASLQRDRGETSFYDGRYVTLDELAPEGNARNGRLGPARLCPLRWRRSPLPIPLPLPHRPRRLWRPRQRD